MCDVVANSDIVFISMELRTFLHLYIYMHTYVSHDINRKLFSYLNRKINGLNGSYPKILVSIFSK